MATITAVAANSPNQPRVETSGTVFRTQRWIRSDSLSVGDIVLFQSIPIPHGAKIFMVKLLNSMDTTSTTSVSTVYTLGLAYSGAVDYTVAWGSATFSQSAQKTVDYTNAYGLSSGANVPWPVTVSVSDDRVERFVYPRMTVDSFSFGSLTGSVTSRFSLCVGYTMDN